jgi:hypothetical protein
MRSGYRPLFDKKKQLRTVLKVPKKLHFREKRTIICLFLYIGTVNQALLQQEHHSSSTNEMFFPFLALSMLIRNRHKKSHVCTFDFELLRDGQKAVELLLGDVHLPLVHEVEDGEQLLVLHPLQVDQGVLVRVPPQHISARHFKNSIFLPNSGPRTFMSKS